MGDQGRPTGDFQGLALDTDNGLVYALYDLNHRGDGVVRPSVDLVEHTFERPGHIGGFVPRAPHGSSSVKELAQAEKLRSLILLARFLGLGSSFLLNSLHFVLMKLCQLSFLAGKTLLVVSGKVFEMTNLLLDLGDAGLQGGFLLGLRLLIGIDLLCRDQLIQRLSRVFSDDGIDLRGGIL